MDFCLCHRKIAWMSIFQRSILSLFEVRMSVASSWLWTCRMHNWFFICRSLFLQSMLSSFPSFMKILSLFLSEKILQEFSVSIRSTSSLQTVINILLWISFVPKSMMLYFGQPSGFLKKRRGICLALNLSTSSPSCCRCSSLSNYSL